VRQLTLYRKSVDVQVVEEGSWAGPVGSALQKLGFAYVDTSAMPALLGQVIPSASLLCHLEHHVRYLCHLCRSPGLFC